MTQSGVLFSPISSFTLSRRSPKETFQVTMRQLPWPSWTLDMPFGYQWSLTPLIALLMSTWSWTPSPQSTACLQANFTRSISTCFMMRPLHSPFWDPLVEQSQQSNLKPTQWTLRQSRRLFSWRSKYFPKLQQLHHPSLFSFPRMLRRQLWPRMVSTI